MKTGKRAVNARRATARTRAKRARRDPEPLMDNRTSLAMLDSCSLVPADAPRLRFPVVGAMR